MFMGSCQRRNSNWTATISIPIIKLGEIVMGFIDHVFRGEVRLWKVFWFGYFIPKIPIILIINVMKEASQIRDGWIGTVIIGLILLYEVWIGIGLFNCAPNVNKKIWFWLGRFVAVFILLSVVSSALKMLKG